jgi:hypothetical protein
LTQFYLKADHKFPSKIPILIFVLLYDSFTKFWGMVFCKRTSSLGLFSFIYHHLENTCVSVGLNVIIFISLVSYFAATCWLWAQALGGWSNVNTWPLQGRPGTVVDVSILFYSLYVFFHIALVGIKHCWFRTLFSGLDGPLVIWVLNLSCYFAKSVLDYQHLIVEYVWLLCTSLNSDYENTLI